MIALAGVIGRFHLAEQRIHFLRSISALPEPSHGRT